MRTKEVHIATKEKKKTEEKKGRSKEGLFSVERDQVVSTPYGIDVSVEAPSSFTKPVI